jgi:hypothetical protein
MELSFLKYATAMTETEDNGMIKAATNGCKTPESARLTAITL